MRCVELLSGWSTTCIIGSARGGLCALGCLSGTCLPLPGATRPDTVAHTLISPLGPGGHVPSAGLQPQRVRPEVSLPWPGHGLQIHNPPFTQGPAGASAHMGLFCHPPEAPDDGVGGAASPPEIWASLLCYLFQLWGTPGVLGLWLSPSRLCLPDPWCVYVSPPLSLYQGTCL